MRTLKTKDDVLDAKGLQPREEVERQQRAAFGPACAAAGGKQIVDAGNIGAELIGLVERWDRGGKGAVDLSDGDIRSGGARQMSEIVVREFVAENERDLLVEELEFAIQAAPICKLGYGIEAGRRSGEGALGLSRSRDETDVFACLIRSDEFVVGSRSREIAGDLEDAIGECHRGGAVEACGEGVDLADRVVEDERDPVDATSLIGRQCRYEARKDELGALPSRY